jgi:hypothetical protein
VPKESDREIHSVRIWSEEFLDKWMNYGHLIDLKNPGLLYNEIRNGLTHEYLLKTDAEVNIGTGPCGIEVLRKGKGRFLRFNLITYYP